MRAWEFSCSVFYRVELEPMQEIEPKLEVVTGCSLRLQQLQLDLIVGRHRNQTNNSSIRIGGKTTYSKL